MGGVQLTLSVNLNLNGGPSKKDPQVSSLAAARRYGRFCLMSTLLINFEWPESSPTDEPESHKNTAPNLQQQTKTQLFRFVRDSRTGGSGAIKWSQKNTQPRNYKVNSPFKKKNLKQLSFYCKYKLKLNMCYVN